MDDEDDEEDDEEDEGLPQRPRTAAGGPAAGGAQPGPECPMELTEGKWSRVMLLFVRAAACKPLALALMYHVVAGKKKKREEAAAQRQKEEDRIKARAAQQEQLQQAAAAEGEGGFAAASESHSRVFAEHDSDADDEAAEAAQAARANEEKLKGMRYKDFHKLAVQVGAWRYR